MYLYITVIFFFKNKAITLITKKESERKKRGMKEKIAKDHAVALNCKYFQEQKKKRVQVTGFSKSLALLEMQSYIARQYWKQASNLFLRLLKYPNELEPLIWRYALIILLHTNDPLHLRQFFEQCIGSQNSNNDKLLKRLLLLPLTE